MPTAEDLDRARWHGTDMVRVCLLFVKPWILNRIRTDADQHQAAAAICLATVISKGWTVSNVNRMEIEWSGDTQSPS